MDRDPMAPLWGTPLNPKISGKCMSDDYPAPSPSFLPTLLSRVLVEGCVLGTMLDALKLLITQACPTWPPLIVAFE